MTHWKNCLTGVVIVVGSLAAVRAQGAEPAWRGVVIARGAEREQIESTDILQRPYRPLHFYGNTVRRQHYRGRSYPTLQDFTRGTAALLVRR
jgi:hypothetical protein